MRLIEKTGAEARSKRPRQKRRTKNPSKSGGEKDCSRNKGQKEPKERQKEKGGGRKEYKKEENRFGFPLESGYCDSNTGPSGPKPDALANCATPRIPVWDYKYTGDFVKIKIFRRIFNFFKTFLIPLN